jgi:hypothetical protein
MGQMVGADPEQLDALGNQMSTCADRLDTIRGEISSLLNHSHWEGADADDFRGAWYHRHSGLLNSAAHATRDGAATLHTNATQQREASATDGSGGLGRFAGAPGRGFSLLDTVEGFAGTYHLADLPFNVLGGLGLASASVSYLAKDKNLPGWLKTLTVTDAKNLKGLGHIAPFLDTAGKALGGLGVGVSAVDFVYNLAKDPGSPETFKAGVDVAFGVATLAASACPPLALGIFAAQLGADYVLEHHPEVATAIESGVVNTAKAMAHAEVQVAEGAMNVGKAVISGGVNAVKGIFHL